MANHMVLFENAGQMPAEVAAAFSGVTNVPAATSVPQLSFRGKTWRIVKDGQENVIFNKDGDPVQSVKVIVLEMQKGRSRSFYEGAYASGQAQAPVCWSDDSIKPDPSCAKIQHPTCAGCPQAAKGSKMSAAGKAMAACAPFKRIVVIPAADLTFEPLLLKIPQTSLWDKNNGENEAKGFYAFDQYMDALRAHGVAHTASIVTRVKFDAATEYPKLLFNATGWVSADEAQLVLDAAKDPRTQERLKTSMVAVASREQDTAGQEESGSDEPTNVGVTNIPAQTAPAAQPAPVAQTAPAAAPAAPKVTKSVPPPPPAAAKPAAPPPPPAATAPATVDSTATVVADPDDAPQLTAQAAAQTAAPAAAVPAAGKKDLDKLLTGWDD